MLLLKKNTDGVVMQWQGVELMIKRSSAQFPVSTRLRNDSRQVVYTPVPLSPSDNSVLAKSLGLNSHTT